MHTAWAALLVMGGCRSTLSDDHGESAEGPADSRPADYDTASPDSAETGSGVDGVQLRGAITPSTRPAVGEPRPDIVVIVTDDQRYDSLWAMPNLQSQMEARGTQFTQAYVTIPLCCPARASIISGGRTAQETGVLANDLPNGGFGAFEDSSTVSTALQKKGYRTAILGKYLNGWADDAPTYVPPGWDLWLGVVEHTDWYAWRFSIGSSRAEPGVGSVVASHEYMTDVLRDQAVNFIEEAGDEPVFLLILPFAPHDPADPALQDRQDFLDWEWRGGAFNEEDMSDKPTWLGYQPNLNIMTIAAGDAGGIKALQSLQAVDRLIPAVFEALEARRGLDESLVVFASDNGVLEGEHRLYGKAVAYQEAVHVPLWASMPGGVTRTDDRLIAMNLDVPATVAEVAGIDLPTDGTSLVRVLLGEDAPRRDFLHLEAWDTLVVPTWSAILTPTDKFVEYVTGDTEYYDLLADPFEMNSLHEDPSTAERIDLLQGLLEARRGLTIATEVLAAEVGTPLEAQLVAQGGEPPFRWTLEDEDSLPPGLILEPDGRIHGTPEIADYSGLHVRVEDSGLAEHKGTPHSYVAVVLVKVEDGAPPALPSWSASSGELRVQLEHPRRLKVWVSREDVGGEWRAVGEERLHPPGEVRFDLNDAGWPGLLRVRLEVDGEIAGVLRTPVD